MLLSFKELKNDFNENNISLSKNLKIISESNNYVEYDNSLYICCNELMEKDDYGYVCKNCYKIKQISTDNSTELEGENLPCILSDTNGKVFYGSFDKSSNDKIKILYKEIKDIVHSSAIGREINKTILYDASTLFIEIQSADNEKIYKKSKRESLQIICIYYTALKHNDFIDKKELESIFKISKARSFGEKKIKELIIKKNFNFDINIDMNVINARIKLYLKKLNKMEYYDECVKITFITIDLNINIHKLNTSRVLSVIYYVLIKHNENVDKFEINLRQKKNTFIKFYKTLVKYDKLITAKYTEVKRNDDVKCNEEVKRNEEVII